ncbi:group II intron reverse transcriptase/maturase [Patescibacteria group bacterium]|nr:MAG: group II intron reverse transcriptase/maturase [Patescibacteria group bacterium]
MGDTPGSQTISMKLQRIAEQARDYPSTVINNLYHLIDHDFLKEAYRLSNKKGAAGVDKVTAKEYAEDLEANLWDLHERLRDNRYVAPPVERVWIEKEDGKKRPIGKPCFEDKIVQRAVVMILEAIFDQIFYSFSQGFRKGHSQHQALQELREQCRKLNINWIVDADVSGFFDNIAHGFLREFIKRKVKDGGIIRLIGKWLNAGVLDAGEMIYPDKGTPQGGVASPMLANIFLHYVLDEWFVEVVQPRIKGRSFLLRWADDFIIGFELEADARRVMEALPKRFSRFNLTIHPEKTKLVRFIQPSSKKKAEGENGTFDFLGFTHYWAKSLRGFWVIKRKTAGKRFRRFMKAIWEWCRKNRHDPIKEQHGTLCAKLCGYYQYYGIIGNYKMLEVVFEHTERAWRYWLGKRSSKGFVSFEKFKAFFRKVFPLPKPRIIHSI